MSNHIPFLVLKSGNISRKFVTKKMRSCDKNFGQLQHLSEEEALLWVKEQKLEPLRIQKLDPAKHIFSHVEWHMTGYVIRVDELTENKGEMLFVEAADSEEHYPIPAAFAAYTKYVHIRLGNEKYSDYSEMIDE